MANMVGADVEAVRRLAAQFEQSATRLRAVSSSVSNGVRVSAWAGPVSVRFRTSWDSEHSVKLKSAAAALENNARILRQNAEEQEAASASLAGRAGSIVVDSNHASNRQPGGFGGFSVNDAARHFTDALSGGTRLLVDGGGAIGFLNDLTEVAHGKGNDFLSHLPKGGYISSGLKGIGLGDALAGFAEGFRRGDSAGMLSSVGDGIFTFVTAPVSVLWTGLKAETGFFIPLDAGAVDDHLGWMRSRGYSDAAIVDRYSGVQGFIDLGNDNVERKAPWMNDIADKVMQKPAEWLYNIGIKF